MNVRNVFASALLLASAAFVAPLQAQVKDLPRAKPEAVGMSSERLARITATLRADVDAKKIPGVVILVARHGKVVLYDTAGKIDPAGSAPMTKDAIFRIYSMTKPITTLTAMMLVEEGRLLLSDPVSKYIPSFAKMQVGVEKPDAAGKPALELVPARRQITIQDLMRHTSGITYGFFGGGLVKAAYADAGLGGTDITNEALADKISKLPLAYQPGTTWDYSHSTDVLGRVIEVITGKPLLQAMKERVLDPLGMKETAFYVTDASRHPRVAEPFGDDRNIGVNANLGDPRVAGKYESGGGGMMSTAMEYARFAQMLLNGGTLEGKRYVSPKTLGYMTSDHLGSAIATTPLYLPGPGHGFGLGFGVRKVSGEAAFPAEAGTYYWGGAGGTYFWVDPKTDLFVVFMMQSPRQRVYYRALMHDMVYAAVMK
jgi:CubicO group peptidase (beta-lactamase class C family)